MEKTIYYGKPFGSFYSQENFMSFLENLKGNKHILTEGNYPPQSFCYYIEPQNVTVCAEFAYIESPAKIRVFGDEKGVGQFERMVIEESKKYGEEKNISLTPNKSPPSQA